MSLFCKKEYSQAGLFLSLFFLYPLFFAVDTLIYAGYSRFNLFVIPPVLAGTWMLIKPLMENRKSIGAIAGLCHPVNQFVGQPGAHDGTKKPLWGNTLTDTSEHYYPYREALEWLKNNSEHEPIMFAGMYYPYSFGFYFGQLGWTPVHTVLMTTDISNPISLAQALTQADVEHINMVLFQVLGDQNPNSIVVEPNFYAEKSPE